jgi:hypothetical protein
MANEIAARQQLRVLNQRQRIEQRFPDGSRQNLKLQKHVLAVDSRDRVGAAETASEYTVNFPPIAQVKKMQLVSTEVPNSQYVFRAGVNNVIDLVDDPAGAATAYTVEITPGSYTATELANEINTQLNAAVGVGFGINFVVTYLTFSKKFEIERILGGDYALNWVSGPNSDTSAAKLLGYLNDFDSTVSGANNASDQIVDLGGENYAFLTLPLLSRTAVASTGNVTDVFAKIIWNVPANFVTYDSFAANELNFEHPIQLLKQLKFKWKNPDGSTYDFNGLEHSFSIEIYSIVID